VTREEELEDALRELVGTTRSRLSSIAYAAPEMLHVHLAIIAEGLDEAERALDGAGR
jgi:hypothetical protein